MQATPDQTDFKPPRPGRWSMPMVLAMVAHLVLIAALTWGVSWQKTAEPVAFEAELWSSVVQEAAPRAVKPPPPPPPKVQPKVEPKPPKPEPKPEPKAEPKQPDTREADIAIEKAKIKKEADDAKKREIEKKKEADKKKADQENADKLEREKKAKVAENEKARKQAEQDAKQKTLDDKIKQLDAKKAQDDLERDRLRNLARIMGQADATGDANAKGTAQRSSGPSASYKAKLSAAFKRHIVFSNPESIAGNPVADVQVTIGPMGRVISARLTRSSGVPAWDSAVLRAAEKTTIPADENGGFPSSFPVGFGPKD